jgi:hypothetical protein
MPVGRISRKRWNANEMVFGKQTYSVTTAPNGTQLYQKNHSALTFLSFLSVDIALIICICVALDEAKHDK